MYLADLKLNIEVLSPVHVASGEAMPASEFFETDKDISVYSMDEIQEGIQDIKRFNNELVSQISHRRDSLPSLTRLSQKGLVSLNTTENRRQKLHPVAVGSSEIMRCMQTREQPYFPGSTLKGNLRTAIIFGLFLQSQDKEKILNDSLKWNGNIDGHFIGRYNKDAFKYVYADDAYFDKYQMAISEEGMYSKGSKGQKFLNIVESIPKGAKAETRIRLDDRYLEDTLLSPSIKKNMKDMEKSDNILFSLYDYTSYMLDMEEAYYMRTDFDRQVSDAMLRQIRHMKDLNKEDAPVIRIGKNTGYLWHTVSGFVIKEMPDYFRKHKNKFAKANRISNNFPTSRKYTQQGADYVGFGYVQLTQQ